VPQSITFNKSLSMMDLFLSADLTIQIIMIGLVMASFWTWAIIFNKYFKLKQLTKKADAFESVFWSGRSIHSLYDKIRGRSDDPFENIFCLAMAEWKKSSGKHSFKKQSGIQQRINHLIHGQINREMDNLESNMGFLSSTASTAPFVGLFGTVLGIMNSFTSISAHQNTSLAVVAPGIAEALLATALGLVAAIPAVVAYNKISSELSRYATRLEDFSLEFSSMLYQESEEKEVA
jgi:biopolymer transport protein TolQ